MVEKIFRKKSIINHPFCASAQCADCCFDSNSLDFILEYYEMVISDYVT